MSKKITLTSITGKLSELPIDKIKSVDVIKDVTVIAIKGRVALPVKESKSRVLKIIEAAKQGGFLLGELWKKNGV